MWDDKMPARWDEVTERQEEDHLLPDQGWPQLTETWMGEEETTTVTFGASGYHLGQVYYMDNLNTSQANTDYRWECTAS